MNRLDAKREISPSEMCSGCGVCLAICPSSAITMELNTEGFYSATIDREKCSGCKLCEEVCPWHGSEDLGQYVNSAPLGSHAAYSRSEDVRDSCSSGGVCFELASEAIAEGIKVCGVKYDALSSRAEHFIADNLSDYMQARGSKYLQSYTAKSFPQLLDGDEYMVFGTPCQILALRKASILKRLKDSLVLVDFFCHGVPSYYLWDYYLSIVNEHLGGSVKSVDFRNKQHGWTEYTMVVASDDHSYVNQRSKGDLFYEFFLGNLCLIEPCYSDCPLRGTNSAADIRVGDCWAADYAGDNKGTSICLSYTQRGKEAIKRLSDSCNLISVPVEDLIRGQIIDGLRRPSMRSSVLVDLQKHRSPAVMRHKYIIPLRYMKLINAAWRKLARLLKRTGWGK